MLELGVTKIDGVVAQAGICPLGSSDVQSFIDAVTVNLNGVVHSVEACLPYLPDGASIVATGSLAAMLVGATDNPDRGAGGLGYSFAKRTVASLVHDLAIVLAPRRIRVNAVHPSNVNTDLLHNDLLYRSFRPDLDHPSREEAEASFSDFHPMGQPFVEPQDVSAVVTFLLADESRYISGMQMRIDQALYVARRPQQPYF